MTETGWPLIPREVLPAPVEAAKRRPQPRPVPSDPSRQLPFFGAETIEPSPADLAGLLAGPGRLGRMGGTARVSVEVDAAWRVHVLVAELVIRGLVVNWHPINQDPIDVRTPEAPELESVLPEMPDVEFDPDYEPPPAGETAPADPTEPPDPRMPPELDVETAGDVADTDAAPDPVEEVAGPRFEVLTAYSSRLNGLARAWPEAAAQLFLSGPRLRLWVAAAGHPVPGGYALGLDPAKDAAEIDAALVRVGLAGRLSDGGRRYLIMGKRRVARLAELVGNRPESAPPELWPGGAGA